MEPAAAALAVGVLIAASIVIGLVARARSGRKHTRPRADVTAADLGIPTLGGVATIVQFSTEYCARCPAVRRALTAIAAAEGAGVVLAEVDLTHRPDLATRFRILTTPTVFVIDAHGAIAASFSGAVTGESVRTEITTLRSNLDVVVT
ncbi:MAG: thioredoxin family protein [Microbacterium sp.]